jgi:hypothetical protein
MHLSLLDGFRSLFRRTSSLFCRLGNFDITLPIHDGLDLAVCVPGHGIGNTGNERLFGSEVQCFLAEKPHASGPVKMQVFSGKQSVMNFFAAFLSCFINNLRTSVTGHC